MSRLKIRLEHSLQVFSIVIYFISILILAEIDNVVTTALFYAAACLCLVCIIAMQKTFNYKFHIYILIVMLSGLINVVFIGNLNLIRLLVLMLGFYIARLLLDRDIKSDILLKIYVIFSMFIFFMMVKRGLGTPVFEYVSNNYVSVYLLAPLTIYYTKTECEGKGIILLPAIIYWILCALATSRMGLLTASVLLLLLMIYKERCKNGVIGARMMIISVVLVAIPIAFIALPYVVNNYGDLYIVNRFLEMGMTSSARNRMWTEYLELLGEKKYLLFGAPTKLVYWSNRFYEGDLHNSYLIVHANIGVVGFIGMIVLLIRSYLYGIRNKRTIFLITMSAFCIRAFTDHVFGCNRLSPVMLFYLLFPMFFQQTQKKIEEGA